MPARFESTVVERLVQTTRIAALRASKYARV